MSLFSHISRCLLSKLSLHSSLHVSLKLLLIGSLLFSSLSQAAEVNPHVKLKTDHGDITLELFPKKAPITVKNFLSYVNERFYDGVIFHRVIPNFMIQTGGMTFDFVEKQIHERIKNESNNGLNNKVGSVAMARMRDPDSAASQFFINLRNNPHLNAMGDRPGYTVFAQVVEGMDVADKIVDEERGLYRAFPDAPSTPIRIITATVINSGIAKP